MDTDCILTFKTASMLRDGPTVWVAMLTPEASDISTELNSSPWSTLSVGIGPSFQLPFVWEK